jgi:hypothetical protein
MPARQLARCVRCGHVAPLRAFEVEVALSADDSGDNDFVINFACPACEAANRPLLLAPDGSPAPRPVPSPGTPGGHRANAIYDPEAP